MSKTITIDDIAPLFRKGWLAYDYKGWAWFENKPFIEDGEWACICNYWCISGDKTSPFKIKPYQGDWKDSLIKVEHSKKKSIDRKDFDDFIEQHGVSPWGFLTEAILKEDFECWKKRRNNE